jgi:desulfoferrodoxin (superoxide reductase-like protein)
MPENNQSRREFVQGVLAVSAVLVVPSGIGCSSDDDVAGAIVVPEWQEVADGLEAPNGPCCYTETSPPGPNVTNRGDASNHLPVLTLRNNGLVIVSLANPHPMTRGNATTPAHWITTMYVRDQDGLVIGFRDFGQSQVKPQFEGRTSPTLEFAMPPGTTSVRAFSYCNLHDVWATDIQRV